MQALLISVPCRTTNSFLTPPAGSRPQNVTTRMSDNSTSTELTLQRNWILGGYASEFLVSSKITQDQASDILDYTARTLRTHLCHDGSFTNLSNIKGRDPLEPVMLRGAPVPTGEELFAVGGRIATGTTESGFIWDSFQYSCLTRFDHFEGARTIVHSTHTTQTPSIPEWLPWWLLGAAAPIEPSFFRLGLEFFTSRFVITRLSFTPIVTDTFLLEVVDGTLACKLKIERPFWKPTNPFETTPILRQLSNDLQKVCGISLSATFYKELLSQGQFSPQA